MAKRNDIFFIVFLFEAAIYLMIILGITVLSLIKIKYFYNNNYDKIELCDTPEKFYWTKNIFLNLIIWL